MIDKIVASAEEAVSVVKDGDTVMIGGFGSSGVPFQLIEALRLRKARDLTVISNNAGVGDEGIGGLLRDRLVRKVVCSYPRSYGSVWFEKLYDEGAIELELVPQGTMAERMRAAGGGVGGFYTRTGYGTKLAEGKETRVMDGKGYVLERPLPADVALLKAALADRWGNLVYDTAGRNFNPIMAMAARSTVAEVGAVVPLGELRAECVVTPGVYVQRVVVRKEQAR
jgi:3-oxoacid CoA-transferase A subunit